MILHAILEELRGGLNTLNGQDNDIVREAKEAFDGITIQIADMVKKQTSHATTLINHKRLIVKIQHDFKASRDSPQLTEIKVDPMDMFIRMLPTKHDLDNHTKPMDEELQNIQEVSSGLIMHMEQYTISECISHRPRLVLAGPSRTQGLARFTMYVDEDGYKPSSVNTQEDAGQYYRSLRGGLGSVDGSQDPEVPEQNNAGGGPLPGGPTPPGGPLPPGGPSPLSCPPPPGGPPLPGGPPAPPPEGAPEAQRKKQKAEDRPIKLKHPITFGGNPGDHSSDWLEMSETFIHDQLETFLDRGTTINWVGGYLTKYAGAWHVQWEPNALAGKYPRFGLFITTT
jgi:hypothetical protein